MTATLDLKALRVKAEAEDRAQLSRFSPRTVIALIDRTEAAEGAIDRVEAAIKDRYVTEPYNPFRLVEVPDLRAALDGTA